MCINASVQMPVPFVSPCDDDCANILMKAANSGYIMKSILKDWGQPEGDEDGRDPKFSLYLLSSSTHLCRNNCELSH